MFAGRRHFSCLQGRVFARRAAGYVCIEDDQRTREPVGILYAETAFP